MHWETVGQLAAAACLGTFVGLERELEAKWAGLRTHMLVALGSALFTIAGYDVVSSHTDPVRLAAQVASGIGFLGAGAIMRGGLTVHGLTTAATLWLTAAVGVAVGLHSWTPAVAATAITVVVLRVVKRAEERVSVVHPTVLLTADLAPGTSPDDIAGAIEERLPGSRTMKVTASASEVSLQMLVRPGPEETLAELSGRLLAIEGLTGVSLGGE
ncbi:MgtC/SapB family protein [Streptomyces beihaiensis]|uniref:MgtC/SapB family protein n=1 Tax=Streptomyces beihaiensis TaxID=2984495 RepID=A0ABT3U221_9ACTN|nr:MgtC/SapB family protein [Streptomyces beihaiensis]MCX3062652.1 MgtC/SapB family protein [Streptomyces beihaiensis]